LCEPLNKGYTLGSKFQILVAFDAFQNICVVVCDFLNVI
jgi:hypothetical protein